MTPRQTEQLRRVVRKNIYNDPHRAVGPTAPRVSQNNGFFGQIVDAGPSAEADYTDSSRYWFKLVELTTTTDSETSVNTWTTPGGADPYYVHSTLEDIASKRADSRLLNVDDIVWVFVERDTTAATTVLRYFCDSGGGAGATSQWMKVIAVEATYVVAKTWDGSETSGDDTRVLPIQGHAVNDLIYATQTSKTSVADTVYVELLATEKSTDLYKVMQVIDSTGRLGLDWVRAH